MKGLMRDLHFINVTSSFINECNGLLPLGGSIAYALHYLPSELDNIFIYTSYTFIYKASHHIVRIISAVMLNQFS